MGGDPDVAASPHVAEAVVRGGADILEVGLPFSDPIADGRSIQAADLRALSSGATPSKVMSVISGVKTRHPGVPVAAMTYYNILYSRGVERFLDSAKVHGVDGLIVPDLPLDEMGDYSRAARARGIDTILLAAPTTSPERLRKIVEETTGFLYLVSLTGVTGAREAVEQATLDLVKRAKRLTRARGVPLGVGFGVSTPEQVVSLVAAGADAVIVGSAIVDRVAGYDAGGSAVALVRVAEYVRSLKEATRRAG